MAEPDANEVRRLALIRYLFLRAKEQSEAPGPLAAASILSLHDAAEWFLYLICEHLDADPPWEFMDYWRKIEDASGVTLTGKASLRRLNNARRELKHRALIPSSSDTRSFADSVETFLEENCMKVFDVSFREISLIELVTPLTAREHLREAVDHSESGNYQDALSAVAIAFEEVHQSADLMGLGRYGEKLVRDGSVGPNSLHPRSFRRGGRDRHDPRLDELLRRLQKILKPMESAIRALSSGIDYQRYLRFSKLTPDVTGQTADGEWIYTGFGPPADPSQDDIDFCIDFVVETALTLESFQEPESDQSD